MMTWKRLAFGVLAAAALVACKEEQKAPPPPPPAAAPPAAAAPAPTASPTTPAATPMPTTAAGGGGGSSIEGAVLFAGTPPEMKPLPTTADPKCPKGVKDESVIVKAGKLAHVWVRVTKGGASGGEAPKSIEVVQEGCMYKPRLAHVQVGQKIVVKNHDDTLHNVHSYLGAATAFNKGMPGKNAPPIEYTPTEEGLIKWKCDVHPWMRGYTGVSKHGLQSDTGDSGEFKIDNVPPGKYTLEAWHEKYGAKTAEVTVEAGKPSRVEFKYDGTEKGS
jgi:plastocyanin